MRTGYVSSILLYLAVASAVEVVYVTDLSIFTSLAPCAQSALSYNVMQMTYDKCPDAVTDLQSCVCTKNQNLASISTAVSDSVSWTCGSTATDDQASAATVLSAYCNQQSTPTFSTPATPVSVYITDVPEISYLAPCASQAVSEVVQGMSYSLCPPAATAMASCICSKNQNSLMVSELINSSAKYSCASHLADVSSAQAMFAAYCAMNDGTTSFPTPTSPPGDMTYYVTALTQYAALAPCAASALSYAVLSQTYDYCPGGPQALASCACIKDGIFDSITSSITSNVKDSCASTATEDISSAMAVFDFYCSAAKAEVSAGGVVESVAQTSAAETWTAAQTGAGVTGTGPNPTSSGTSTGTSRNGSNASNSATGSAGNSGGKDGTEAKSSSTAVIAGGVVGGVVGLAALGTLIFFLVRRSHTKQADVAAAASSAHGKNEAGNSPDYGGKPELAGNPINAVGSPSPSSSTLKANANVRTHAVSPVSGDGAWASPPSNQAELHGQEAVQLMGYPQNAAYQQGHAYPSQPLAPQEAYGQPVYEMHQQQQPVQWTQSRPVTEYERQLSQQQQHTGWSPAAELDAHHPVQTR